MPTSEAQEPSLPPVQVVVRIRPSLDSEEVEVPLLRGEGGTVRLSAEENCEENIADRDCRRVRKPQDFRFSSVFGPSTSQEEVYQGLNIDELIAKVAEGYHATVFAYGQTGSGKTYTMEGYRYRVHADGPQVCIDETTPESLGVIPRALRKLFAHLEHLQESDAETESSVSISFLQIYQEKIYDLLNPAPLPQGVGPQEDAGLRLRWDSLRECFFVENLFVYQCATADDALRYYNAGVHRKQMATTSMNIASSRSHTVLMLSLQRRSHVPGDDQGVLKEVTSNLTLVDLAGSEKAAASEAAERFKEAVNINQSLFVLRRVITALSRSGRDEHVPYRESKLTSLLQHAIGGKGFMVMLACLSPANKFYEENLSTLQYASQAALIQNEPVINLDPKDRLIEQLQQQLLAAHEYILQHMGLEELPEELRANSVRPVKVHKMSSGKASGFSLDRADFAWQRWRGLRLVREG
ncbi:Kinesin-like protein KIF3A (Microtubule plus end-directed kinesin motor 3A) [Durusdinium trenchii]|uniref:Kinesin-like protein KIF3A (Microtubule plus end-directed kinesin motor 3A) n=1 Tax=Durusdinium trenchii TaxID=1381693 RepID=A0ABP0KVG3_9DINO